MQMSDEILKLTAEVARLTAENERLAIERRCADDAHSCAELKLATTERERDELREQLNQARREINAGLKKIHDLIIDLGAVERELGAAKAGLHEARRIAAETQDRIDTISAERDAVIEQRNNSRRAEEHTEILRAEAEEKRDAAAGMPGACAEFFKVWDRLVSTYGGQAFLSGSSDPIPRELVVARSKFSDMPSRAGRERGS